MSEPVNSYAMICGTCGHRFSIRCNKTEFTTCSHPCPTCRDTATSRAPIGTGGGVEINDAKLHFDRMYPYVSYRSAHFPDCPKDPKTGHTVIVSAAHEREIMAREGLRRE